MQGRRRRGWALVGALLLSVAGMLPVTLTGAMAVQLQADLGISSTWIGVLVSVFFIAGAGSAARLGAATDRVGWRRASVLGGGASAVALVAMAVVPTVWVAVLVLAVGGGAMTASVATSNLVLAEEMPGHRLGFLLGLKQSAIPIAGLGSGLAVPIVALTLGWRWAFVFAVAAPLGAVAVARAIPATGGDGQAPADGVRPAPRPAPGPFTVTRRLRTMAVGMGFASVIPSALTGFLVLTAVGAGMTEGAAGTLLAACSLVGICIRIGYGWGMDRARGDGVGHVALLLAGGTVGAALLATGRVGLVVPGAVLAFACGWGWPGVFFYELIRDHPTAPAAATGVAQGGALVGSALGPLAFGRMADAVGTGPAWAGVAVLSGVAALIMVAATRMPRPDLAPRHGRDLPTEPEVV